MLMALVAFVRDDFAALSIASRSALSKMRLSIFTGSVRGLRFVESPQRSHSGDDGLLLARRGVDDSGLLLTPRGGS